MIKNFKIFEMHNIGEPEKGHYVITYPKFANKDVSEFFKSMTGRIEDKINNKNNITYVVIYDISKTRIPSDILISIELYYSEAKNILKIPVYRYEILLWSKDKKDLEENKDMYLNLIKFNI